MSNYSVRVSKDYLGFSSAHFITFVGGAEKLHGHNYRVAVTLEGTLGPDSYVFDFIALKRICKTLCDRLDHCMLLPSENEHIVVKPDGDDITVHVQAKTYRFPAEDVVLLPVSNITAEMLAWYISEQLRIEPTIAQVQHLTAIEVEVEESFGQSARFRQTRSTDGML